MFHPLQLEVMERFTAVKEHFRASRRFRGGPAQTAKGIVFVEVYGIWEYTLQTAVKAAGQAISSQGYSYAQLRPSLLALFMHQDLQSIRDLGETKVWERSLKLFSDVFSKRTAELPNPPLPFDDSHFRHRQLQLILRVFGVKRSPTRRKRHLYRITEVVDNRNRIAHGEETAAAIGRRYSRRDVTTVIRQMESVCLRVIEVLRDHCTSTTQHCR